MALLQTLDRGLQALDLVARHPQGVSVARIAQELAIHRAIAYRLVATLEAHRLVRRGEDGTVFLGLEAHILPARAAPQLRSQAGPILRDLAQTSRATAFLSAAEGWECVALMVAQPPDEQVLSVGYRVGSRHALDRGAAGLAILAGRPESPADSQRVKQVRRQGYSVTQGELQRGAVGVASPVPTRDGQAGGLEMSLGVVALADLDTETAIPAAMAAARRLGEALG